MSEVRETLEQRKDPEAGAENGGGVRALERGLQLLKCFDMQHPDWRIADLARAVGLHKATARRLIKTLEAEAFLELDSDSGEYRLGPAFLPVVYLARSHEAIARVAHPFLERLAADTGETAGLFVWTSNGIMLVDSVQTIHLFKPTLVSGSISTTYGTSHSKILLAYGPEERLSKMSFGDSGSNLSLAEITQVHEELQEVRDSGIAYELGERATGARAVGVPIRDSSGEVVAAISVVVPRDRFNVAQREYISIQARATAAAVSTKLGFSG